MKKQNQKKQTPEPHKSFKARKEILMKPISLEVDLESRELFFTKGSKEQLSLPIESTNLDSVIQSYLPPKESKLVMEKLSKAEKGLEKPIPFYFVHPLTSKKFHFEYRYKIEYVKYSSTRLRGELVKTSVKKSTK